MKRFLFCGLALLAAFSGWGAALPGFRVEVVAPVAGGFLSSLAVDSAGNLYYTTTNGAIRRVGGGVVGKVDTVAIGNSGLLGMALRDDRTAIVHYTTKNQVADVLSAIDLGSGAEQVIASFNADIDVPERGSPAEHHGGNPIVAADGSIFFGIGDYGGGYVASLPDWNGGKIFRVRADGSVQQFARGLRNPFDMAWDAARDRLIVPDNGAGVDDEINLVRAGDNCGWPFTEGDGPPIAGDVGPVYVFPVVVAPTGFLQLSGKNDTLQHGYLLATFVTKAIYYIRDIDKPNPLALIKAETGNVIDVVEGPDGTIYFGTGFTIYRLVTPQRGDCNGDGKLDANDFATLLAELADGSGERADEAQNGAVRASFGCDANGDGLIDEKDVPALQAILKLHVHAARGR